MMGEEGRPGKKLKKTVKVKKAERPPANPVVDVRAPKYNPFLKLLYSDGLLMTV